MATWGTKVFEEDSAFDWISELVDAEDTRHFLVVTLESGESEEELDGDMGSCILAASEVILSILDEPRKGVPTELTDWLDTCDCDDLSDLAETSLEHIDRVLADGSAYHEQWKEAEDYADWLSNVEELRDSLEQVAGA